MEKILFSNLPILEDQAIELFKTRTTRRTRGETVDVRVMKLSICSSYDFYWVQYLNDRPQLDLVLKVMSGKGTDIDDISEGAFYTFFQEKDIVQMKRTEKIADKLFLLNRVPKIKFLAIATEEEAKAILETEEVYIASIQVKNGKYAFPVWVDAKNTEGYKTVSFWGRKQTMKEVDFINPLEIGEKLYRKVFTIAGNENGLYLAS